MRRLYRQVASFETAQTMDADWANLASFQSISWVVVQKSDCIFGSIVLSDAST